MLEIVQVIFNPNVIVPLVIFSIPLSAIVGTFYLKVQKLKLQRNNLNQEEFVLLKKTLEENKELKRRVENLEMIVTSFEKDTLMLREEYKIDKF